MIRPYRDITWEAEQLYRIGRFDQDSYLQLKAEAAEAVKAFPEGLRPDLIKKLDMYAPASWTQDVKPEPVLTR